MFDTLSVWSEQAHLRKNFWRDMNPAAREGDPAGPADEAERLLSVEQEQV